MKKRALICGVSGQDGSYMAKLLLEKGYEVWGSSRDAQVGVFENLERLKILEKVKLLSVAPNDFRSVISAISKCDPHEIYNLSGQSSVGLSFEQPAETLESISLATLNFLEAIRFINVDIKYYNASSSECFGDMGGIAATESTPFSPRSPYAVAKSSAHWLVSNYREAYGLHACSGILFNHESPLRPKRFVTQKIISAVANLASGSDEKLHLGRLDIVRDWGWAPEYVEAMWLMLQQEQPGDFVIASGESNSLENFVAKTFEYVGLDWKEHVVRDESLYRPTDLVWGRGNPAKAKLQLNWQAKFRMNDVIKAMLASVDQ